MKECCCSGCEAFVVAQRRCFLQCSAPLAIELRGCRHGGEHTRHPHSFRRHSTPSGVRTVMENLEKSWNFKIVISRPGKVRGVKKIPKVLEKSQKCCYIHVYLR